MEDLFLKDKIAEYLTIDPWYYLLLLRNMKWSLFVLTVKILQKLLD